MTISVSTQASPVGSKLVIDTSANATARNAVTGASGVLYTIEIDNTGNASAVYLKVYDAPTVTVGTTVPDLVFKMNASVKRCFVIPEGMAFTDLSFACVTAGGTTGTTGPTNPVIVRMVTT